MKPPPITPVRHLQRAKDEEHLNLLATFHDGVAAIGALLACILLIRMT